MTEPRTQAGRAWVGHFCDFDDWEHRERIRAIEAEAIEQERARLLEGVGKLPSPDPSFPGGYYTADMISRAAVESLIRGDTEPLPEGFVRCPLCGEAERAEDMVGRVCLTCADAITFGQHARRAAVVIRGDTEGGQEP